MITTINEFKKHMNEGVRHETKFMWWVNKDFTFDTSMTENDLAEDAFFMVHNEIQTF